MTRFLRCGREAVLVELNDLSQAIALYASLSAADLPGVTDLVPAARTVLIHLDPAVTSPDAVRAAVESRDTSEAAAAPARAVRIPVVYDGPDLADVAALLQLTPGEVVARHTGTPWTVAFTGFAPGFGYLTGGDPVFDVPRRESPRTRVPAGSVGLAGRFSGVYPTDSPGGWQLIGRTGEHLWDLDGAEPALLLPGATVTFEAETR
ncbi:allophanate hydrolase subunit 1 [Actinoplanes sp. TBRC 11911]|uniref:5-oxoprolinase subunit B family protein n=1 Tax=Actinoplanes sp. TBRC 11911 TaxID=2729386 RepID=UPI00145CB676|nr:allophanate hydrolase subunit 1 [Actinoplanes sp. TBRC 11911]NMO49613.1 allophanate hydrolase subunit 1 [Actinoplanes sp. TBRC 11911]